MISFFIISGFTSGLFLEKDTKAEVKEIKIQVDPVVLPASTKISVTTSLQIDDRFRNAKDETDTININVNK